MLWTGYPETTVTQLTCEEWLFSLRPQREVQIGYAIRVGDAWELFGNGHWVWFTGAVAGSWGAIQQVAQWAEVQPLGPRQRVWQWVHWRNPSDEEVIVRPYLLLAPPIEPGWLMQSAQTTTRKRIWTLVDGVTAVTVAALGSAVPGTGGGTHRQGLEPALAVRPLAGQHVQELELEGDLRYLPLEELSQRIEQLRDTTVAGQQTPSS
jgi:hypothetical protein